MDLTPCTTSRREPRNWPRDLDFLAQLSARVTLRALPALGLLVAACATPPAAPPRVAAAPLPPSPAVARLTGKSPAAVIALLGAPAFDRVEGRTRQLQYRGAACILDVFAVAAVAGQPATIGHVEARTLRGDRADAAACLGGLLPH